MGLFDEVWFEKELARFPPHNADAFKPNHSLNMERYTVTKAGGSI